MFPQFPKNGLQQSIRLRAEASAWVQLLGTFLPIAVAHLTTIEYVTLTELEYSVHYSVSGIVDSTEVFFIARLFTYSSSLAFRSNNTCHNVLWLC